MKENNFMPIVLAKILLYLHLGTVSTDLVCPSVVKDVDFKIILEIQYIPESCLLLSNATIAIDAVDSIVCEKRHCQLKNNVPKFNYTIKELFNNSGLQYEFTLQNDLIMSLPLGNYTALWSCGVFSRTFKCQVVREVSGPDCHWSFYSSLPSWWTINTTVYFEIVCDNYEDSFLTFYYEDDDYGPFTVEFITRTDKGSFMLKATLTKNFEGTYKYFIKLENSAGHTTLLTVLFDVFKKPVVKEYYYAFVFENQLINDPVTDIKVSGVSPKANLIFYITEGNMDNVFSISRDGKVTVAHDLSSATREVYHLQVKIRDRTSELEMMTELIIQLLPVCNLTFWNPHCCSNLYLNATVGTLKCFGLIKFFVSPNITIQDDDNFNFSISDSDNGNVLLNYLGSCLYNLSFNIMVSYRNYHSNLTWMVMTQSYRDNKGLCIQGNDSNQSPLFKCVFEECEKPCTLSTESTVLSTVTSSTNTEINTTQNTREETTIKVYTEISVFHTTEVYSFGDVYLSGNLSGNNTNLFALAKNDGKLQLVLTQELSEDDVGSYLLTFSMSDINVTKKYIINIKVKSLEMSEKTVFLKRTQTEKDGEVYQINSTFLFNDTDAKIDYKILRSGNIQFQIVNDSIRLLQELPRNITHFTIILSATYNNVTQYAKIDFLIREYCPLRRESYGVVFIETLTEQFYKANCPFDDSGEVLRYCQKNATWEPYILQNCSRYDLTIAVYLAENLNSSCLNMSVVKEILENINNAVNKYPSLTPKDIEDILNIMRSIGKVFRESQAAVEIVTLETIVSVANQLISLNSSTLHDKKHKAAEVLESLEILASAATKALSKAMKNITIVKNNIAITLSAFSDAIEFDSSRLMGWMNETVDKVSLPVDSTAGLFNYSIILYKSLADSIMLNRSLQEKYNETELLMNKVVNSRIISISVTDRGVISKPVKITLSYLNNSFSGPVCGFLNDSVSEKGLWSTDGCTTESVTKDYVTCSCTHLTNFAVLMSPVGMLEDNNALTIITIVGCSISFMCLVLTVIIYCTVWKYMKNDRSALHLNLSLCLIIGYTVFLSGIDKTNDKVGCIVVAALLHFFFLSTHFIMLAEGIEIIKSISFVFSSKSILHYLLVGAYGIPLLIVFISLVITKTNGYGNNAYCWLSVTDGLLWSFVGPMLIVFLANFIIMITVIQTMQTTQSFKDKTFPYKIKSAVRSICVLSPILGLTWIFGVLSVNKESVVFQYLFAIFNSLQGLFIFIFQCVLQHRVRDGLKEIFRKYKAQSLDSDQRQASASNSVQGYGKSFKSKCYNVQKSTAASKKLSVFSNAIYENHRVNCCNSQEDVPSNSGAEEYEIEKCTD